jgi:hypothetical protein
MSGIKQVLFAMMEQEHELASHRSQLSEEEKAMAVYDHVRADEVDSTVGQEEYAE